MSVPTETPDLPDCGGEQFIHPGSENILLIVYVSLALGITSFFSFCVRRIAPTLPLPPAPNAPKQADASLVLAPEMEVTILRENEPPPLRSQPPYPPRQLLGMDPLALQGDRGAGLGLRRPGRFRCMYSPRTERTRGRLC